MSKGKPIDLAYERAKEKAFTNNVEKRSKIDQKYDRYEKLIRKEQEYGDFDAPDGLAIDRDRQITVVLNSKVLYWDQIEVEILRIDAEYQRHMEKWKQTQLDSSDELPLVDRGSPWGSINPYKEQYDTLTARKIVAEHSLAEIDKRLDEFGPTSTGMPPEIDNDVARADERREAVRELAKAEAELESVSNKYHEYESRHDPINLNTVNSADNRKAEQVATIEVAEKEVTASVAEEADSKLKLEKRESVLVRESTPPLQGVRQSSGESAFNEDIRVVSENLVQSESTIGVPIGTRVVVVQASEVKRVLPLVGEPLKTSIGLLLPEIEAYRDEISRNNLLCAEHEEFHGELINQLESFSDQLRGIAEVIPDNTQSVTEVEAEEVASFLQKFLDESSKQITEYTDGATVAKVVVPASIVLGISAIGGLIAATAGAPFIGGFGIGTLIGNFVLGKAKPDDISKTISNKIDSDDSAAPD